MQKRCPVGPGPSSNTCPRWPPHLAHTTSVRSMPWLVSLTSLTLLSLSGFQKLGQPVPESNFVSDENSSAPQPAHTYIPFSCLFQYLPLKAGSVPFSLSTRYCSSVNLSFHSLSLFGIFFSSMGVCRIKLYLILSQDPAKGPRQDILTLAKESDAGEEMLRSLKGFGDFGLQAKDGEIGSVDEVFFDDRKWTVRYLVLKPQKWLSGRKVLLSTSALGRPDWKKRLIPANLTKAQIGKSPDVDLHKPASRQDEERLIKYYKWEFYWSDPDFYLQSSKDLMGYKIEASDGTIGLVTDFVFDDSDWRIRYLIVDTSEWLPGKKVLVAMDWIELVLPDEKRVKVDLTKDEIKGAPQYDPKALPSREYEKTLYKYYGKRSYWI